MSSPSQSPTSSRRRVVRATSTCPSRIHRPTRLPEGEDLMTAEIPSRDDSATVSCPMCTRPFAPVGRGRYCSDGCRKKAWRRRHQPGPTPIMVPAPGVPRRPITVYECAACGTRALGDQRCETCGAFMSRVGLGGLCPHCDGAVAVSDLLDEHTAPSVPPAAPQAPPARRRRSAGTEPTGTTKGGRR